jgi:hypothetical protein
MQRKKITDEVLFALDPAFEQAVKHSKAQNTLVRDTLKGVAKQIGKPYSGVLSGFVNHNALTESITMMFWETLWKQGHDYNRVEICHCCNQFRLWKEREGS